VIYGLKNSLFIEQPSGQQRKFAQLDEEKRIHMEKSEFKKLLKASSEEKASGDGITPGVAEKSKFKRNRAKVIFTPTLFQCIRSLVRVINIFELMTASLLFIQILMLVLLQGPNPLSCKKKKPRPQPSDAQSQVIIATHSISSLHL
jgi:U3 small nucleolar RNA-associated protein 23